MMETSTEAAAALEDGGTMEIVRVPSWEAKYVLSQNPDELVHFVCCRDLVWRAVCGYEEPDPSILPEATEATTFCTMCVEVIDGLGCSPGSRQCPFDDQPCPDDETVHQMIAERTSRP